MRFVVVNGRSPRPESSCALCCQPILDGYLRDLATQLSYCDRKCYAGRCKFGARVTQFQARAS